LRRLKINEIKVTFSLSVFCVLLTAFLFTPIAGKSEQTPFSKGKWFRLVTINFLSSVKWSKGPEFEDALGGHGKEQIHLGFLSVFRPLRHCRRMAVACRNFQRNT